MSSVSPLLGFTMPCCPVLPITCPVLHSTRDSVCVHTPSPALLAPKFLLFPPRPQLLPHCSPGWSQQGGALGRAGREGSAVAPVCPMEKNI